MRNPQEYAMQIEAVLGGDELRIQVSSIPQAKQAIKSINQLQKRLRQIKKEVNFDMKEIRTYYRNQSSSAGQGTAALFSVFGKRKAAGQIRAAAKRDIARERDAKLRPYDSLKFRIDDAILKLDNGKIQLQGYIESQQE